MLRLRSLIHILYFLPTFSAFVAVGLEQPYISAFKLVNANTSKVYRSLTNFDVISAEYPWTIIAIVSPSSYKPRSVTFITPLRRTEYFAPFSLSGDTSRQGYFPLNIAPGLYTLSAYVDENTNRTTKIDFVYHTSLPQRGPLPTEVTPSPLGKEDKLHIPASTCNRTSPARLYINHLQQSSYYQNGFEALLELDWCHDANSVRLRTMRFEQELSPDRATTTRTAVMSQGVYDYIQYGVSLINFRRCEPMFFFYEACVKSHTGDVMCHTSSLKYIIAEVVTEPRLEFRPPIQLELAPKDSAKIRTVTRKVSSGERKQDGLSNGGFDRHNYYHALQGVIDFRDGRKSTTPWKEGAAIDVLLKNVTGEDNGAVVFTRYAKPTCPGNFASWRSRYATTLVVSHNIPSLVQQDESLPSFSTPVYPPTRFGKTVSLRVNATNMGGGRRADGSATQLHYQWYLRTGDSFISERSYAEPIIGATASILWIKSARCSTLGFCSRWGCTGLQIFYVDVCNTFGCKRSDPIIPNVLPPDFVPKGKVFDHFLCKFREK